MATVQFFGIILVAGTAGGAAVYALTYLASTVTLRNRNKWHEDRQGGVQAARLKIVEEALKKLR
jgi:hypothetical protein